jgi:sugar transferase EpsL
MYRRFLKRGFDVFLSVLGLLLLSPLFAIIWLVIVTTMGRPVLFRQVRQGFEGRSFELLKFRTMTNATDVDGRLLPDNQRLTNIGRFLRSTSLDELPELINVLRGDMSLVGPRPLLTKYDPYYTDRERLRFAVRPGITGLAQVSGRNRLPWDERLELDAHYVNSCSFATDLRILWLTAATVLGRRGLEVDPGAIMNDLDVERRYDQRPLA